MSEGSAIRSYKAGAEFELSGVGDGAGHWLVGWLCGARRCAVALNEWSWWG